MKNFILKNKVKILLTLFFTFLLLILNNNVFAVEITDDLISQAQEIALSHNSSYFIILRETSGSYNDGVVWLEILPADTSRVYKDTSGYTRVLLNSGSTGKFISYHFDTNTNTFIFNKNLSSLSDIFSFEYSTIDVMSGETGDEIFFLKAPPEEETPKATTLLEIMEQVEKEAVLKEIVILLPVILSVLVSLIALRKALKMLLGSLRTS